MRTCAAAVLQRGPRRSQPGNAARPYRRGELAAGLGTMALIGELLLLPAAVPVSLVLLAVGWVSRWRLQWLFLPVLASVGWLAVAGPRWAVTGLATEPGRLIAGLMHAAADPVRLRAPGSGTTTALGWLPRELPVALAAGAAQAGLVLWLSQRGGRWSWRPGLMAAAQRRRGRALLAAGHTVTAAGCAFGLDTPTGRLAGLSWADAEQGVLLTASDPGELSAVALAVVCAALRRRKTVLVFDIDGGRDAAALTEPAALLAGALDVQVSRASRPDGALAAAIGRAVRARGVLLASGPGPLLTGEVTALLGWLREHGLRGDSLLCLSGCEGVDAALVADLLALGPSTGTAMLVTTTSAACAEALAGYAGQTLACGPVSQELSARLISSRAAADDGQSPGGEALTRQRPGDLTVFGADDVRPSVRAVPIRALGGLSGVLAAAALQAATGAPAAAGSR